jgi:hypothetical protein
MMDRAEGQRGAGRSGLPMGRMRVAGVRHWRCFFAPLCWAQTSATTARSHTYHRGDASGEGRHRPALTPAAITTDSLALPSP